MKQWPRLSLFFQLDRKAGGRGRGRRGSYNLFGINGTMKSLLSGPALLYVCVCVCVSYKKVMVCVEAEGQEVGSKTVSADSRV